MMNNNNENFNYLTDGSRSEPITLDKPSPASSGRSSSTTSSDIKRFVRGSVKLTGKYIAAKLISTLCMAVFASLALWLIGVPLPVLCGLFAAVFNLIPMVGESIGVIGVAAFAFAFEPMNGLWALLIMIVLQGVDDYLITPAIAGQALDLRPALIVFVTIAAGLLLGGWGVIIAVPVAGILKLGFDIFYLGKKDSGK